ncbi:hypothetical protein [Sporosarcina luteola]|uniref:hypothetical protein n=1 Tax=Sporosarcina luteola TaxID=582850 RepID=UPI002042258C|nr:hypothetical protein [Sporosarcina luteola]MCM3711506.1 hypothetical protein [Sporosarcina luteola]
MIKKLKLITWEPTVEFTKEFIQVVKFDMSFNDKGLTITLVDKKGTRVDITYDKGTKYLGDYVVSYRYTSEIPMSILALLAEKARDDSGLNNFDSCFYKALHSDYLDQFKPHFPGNLADGLEHHIFPVGTGIVEVISDYDPSFTLTKATY